MKKYIFLYALVLCAFIGCKDNSGLYGLLEDMDNRIVEVEKQCDQLNTNIEALQILINAQQTGDYITAITPIMSGGVEIGYTITFAKHTPITIYHGQNGKDGKDGQNGTNGTNGTNGQDGHTPIIGAAQDTDGVYYWTLDGTWLLDGSGNKIRVTGQDGKDGKDGTNGTNGTNGADGITPQLKIEADYWWISYDNGATWTQLGKAKGDKGADGQDGDSMFQSVTQDENFVYFTLTNGTIIKIAKNNISDFEQTVKDNMVTSLTLTSPKDTIAIGEQITLTALTTPFPDSKKIWFSSNTNVATAQDSVVTGISVGIINITVTSGDKSTSHKIYVKSAEEPYFSVSATQRVQFSPAYLQYKRSTGTWSFAKNQQTFTGKKQTEADVIDRFPFGSSGYSKLPTDPISPRSVKVNINGTNHDWGVYNVISGWPANTWRTPTKEEWTYLLQQRANAGSSVFQIECGKKGWMILPDNWQWPIQVSSLPSPNNKYSSINQDNFDILQLAGAIFLPFASTDNADGPWTSTAYGDGYAYFVRVGYNASMNIDVVADTYSGMLYAYPVRLVKDLE